MKPSLKQSFLTAFADSANRSHEKEKGSAASPSSISSASDGNEVNEEESFLDELLRLCKMSKTDGQRFRDKFMAAVGASARPHTRVSWVLAKIVDLIV